jgi:hypothetical protein
MSKKTTPSPAQVSKKKRNWKKYNENLAQRGIFSLWLDECLLREWRSLDVRNKPIFEKFYPDEVIEFCLLISAQYHQKLRQTVGLVKHILTLCGLEHLPVPDFSTLSRRASSLAVTIGSKRQENKKNVCCNGFQRLKSLWRR